jgi:hypothetical protein
MNGELEIYCYRKKIELLKQGWLITLFLMEWHALMPDVMLEFMNTLLINSANIYFGHNDKVYAIGK